MAMKTVHVYSIICMYIHMDVCMFANHYKRLDQTSCKFEWLFAEKVFHYLF